MKGALLIGIDYKGKDNQLNGCMDDVKEVKKYLEGKGYTEFVVLVEDGELPNCENIMRGFNTMLNWVNSGDYEEIFIHYSGHGSHIVDRDGDEDDGYDEVLIPLDYDKHGIITDDLINLHFVSKITNPDTKIYILTDCCHSGTIMDLEYHWKREGWCKVNDKKTVGNIICISGCKDSEESAEVYNINNNRRWSGALTTTFLEYVQKNISLGDIVNRLILKLVPFGQFPQLTASHKVDLNINIL